jgi:hypothetical protein
MLLGSSGGPLFRLAPDGAMTQLTDPQVPIYDGSAWNGVVTHDPVTGEYLVLTPTEREFWSYAIDGETWSMLPAQPPVDITDGAVVAAPIDTYGVTMFTHCKSGTCGVLLYQHAQCDDCPGPDPDTGGDDGTDSAGDDTDPETGSQDAGATDDGDDAPADSSADAGSTDPAGTDAGADGEDAPGDASGCACRTTPRRGAGLLALAVLALIRGRARTGAPSTRRRSRSRSRSRGSRS